MVQQLESLAEEKSKTELKQEISIGKETLKPLYLSKTTQRSVEYGCDQSTCVCDCKCDCYCHCDSYSK